MGNESAQHCKLNSAKTNRTKAMHKVHTIEYEMSIYKQITLVRFMMLFPSTCIKLIKPTTV